MSRAETLAGLTEAIAGHDDYTPDEDSSDIFCAGCLAKLDIYEDSHAGFVAALNTHVAAVALAWLEGHMTEEWGVRVKLSPIRSIIQQFTTEDAARADVAGAMRPDLVTVVRRHITAWTPVEGDQP